MNVDSFFTIGSTHKVCQDYVLHGYQNDKPYVILSDGCSSAVDSDFGSRLLCKSLQPFIYNNNYNINSLLDTTIKSAHFFSRSLNLQDDSLCATLVFLKIFRNCFQVFAVGDFVIAAKHKNGSIQIIECEYVSQAPYYLRYELDGLKEEYFEKFGKKVKFHSYWIKNNEIYDDSVTMFDPFTDYHFYEFFINDYEFVAIMSDGAKSFLKTVISATTKQNISASPLESLKEILSFKKYFGEFVQRRCQKAFKQFKDQNIHNYDDFSIGVISTE